MAILLVATASTAYAGDADVCYQSQPTQPASQRMPPAQMAELTSKTVFDCPRAGKHTLSELAQDGWSIVSVSPVAAAGGMKWMVIIQKK